VLAVEVLAAAAAAAAADGAEAFDLEAMAFASSFGGRGGLDRAEETDGDV
jgi:hypothetical protein